MRASRRTFLKTSVGAAAALVLSDAGQAQAPAKEQLLVNHVGFAPHQAKSVIRRGTSSVSFAVVDRHTDRVVHQGTMVPRRGDFGKYLIGDFSGLNREGSYEVRSSGVLTALITISDDIYTPSIRKSINYFAVQRCGDSQSGYHAPCHLDDGRRSDNGKHENATGGWHDACDVRKWVNATLYGMIGLSRVIDVRKLEGEERDQMVDELRWGNEYFRRIQEPDGYLMNYCGGDDGNHFTDNRAGTSDDRIVHVEPTELAAQFNYVAAQAAMIRYTREVDEVYASSCQRSAARCLEWCMTRRTARAAKSLSAGIIACAQLHRVSREERLRDTAAGYLKLLLSLQATDSRRGELTGFFRAKAGEAEPYRDIMNGNLPLLALCEALERFPTHPDADEWKQALELHTEYLVAMSARSIFGTVPFGLYLAEDPGGDRRIGQYWYRWFMKRQGETDDDDWWVGINAHLASNGVGLCRAARILENPRLAHLAQRQLDWIIGVNPFNASTISGVGRNQPGLYITGQFKPATPEIPGGVMNGIGGHDDDQPALDPRSYHTSEYWTPMVAYTMWLMAELMAR